MIEGLHQTYQFQKQFYWTQWDFRNDDSKIRAFQQTESVIPKTIDQEAAQSQIQIVQPTFNKKNKTPEVPFVFSIFESSTSHTHTPIFPYKSSAFSKVRGTGTAVRDTKLRPAKAWADCKWTWKSSSTWEGRVVFFFWFFLPSKKNGLFGYKGLFLAGQKMMSLWAMSLWHRPFDRFELLKMRDVDKPPRTRVWPTHTIRI